jgi:hypothetical protein
VSRREKGLLFGGIAVVALLAAALIATNINPTSPSLCQCGSICIEKFEDLDCDGIHDDNEPNLHGWSFTITDANGNLVTTIETTSSSALQCVEVSPGTYTITEVAQSGWVLTSPAGGTTTVTVPPRTGVPVSFGNTTTTCITIQVLSVFDSSPVSNFTVIAESPQGNVTGTTDANGLVCLIVKIDTVYTVWAYGSLWGSSWATPDPITVTSPSWGAGPDDCGTSQCPLVGTVYVDLLVSLKED